MYKIKQVPEDFFVKEVARRDFREKGDYAYYLMRKRNYTTQRAAERVADFLGISNSAVGYAGLKDRNAVTEQFISVRSKNSPERISLPDIELELLGRGYLKIGIGELEGNQFRIIVRNLEPSDLIRLYNRFTDEEIREDFQLSESGIQVLVSELNEIASSGRIFFPNYFGSQRFSKHNWEVGMLILKRDFEAALKKILSFDIPEDVLGENWGSWNKLIEHAKARFSREILQHLTQNSSDYIGALRRIPKRILRLYIGGFQARIFNKVLASLVSERFEEYFEVEQAGGRMVFPAKAIRSSVGETIPLPGFGSENSRIVQALAEEGVSPRDFIIREMPELSAEGSERQAFCEAENLEIGNLEKDELNSGKFKITISFYLRKGSYATVFLRSMLG